MAQPQPTRRVQRLQAPPLDQGRQAPGRPRILQGPQPQPRASRPHGRGHQVPHTDPRHRLPGAKGREAASGPPTDLDPDGAVELHSPAPAHPGREDDAPGQPPHSSGATPSSTTTTRPVPLRLAHPRMPMHRRSRGPLRAGPQTPPPIPGPSSLAPQPPQILPNRRVQPGQKCPLALSQSKGPEPVSKDHASAHPEPAEGGSPRTDSRASSTCYRKSALHISQSNTACRVPKRRRCLTPLGTGRLRKICRPEQPVGPVNTALR